MDLDGGGALLLPSRQAARAASAVLIVAGLGLAVLAGFLIPGGRVIAVLGGVVLGLLGLLLLAAGLFALRRRPRTVGIVLTPEHVVLNWTRPEVRLPWEAIHEIRPLAVRLGSSGTAPSRNYLGVVAREPGSVDERVRKVAAKFGPDVACAVSMRTVDVDQLVVLHTLRFYRDNPQAREELAGEAALARVREARLAGAE